MPASVLKINVLGSVQVLLDGKPIRLFRQEVKALSVLVAARGQAVSGDTLAAAIWADDVGPAHDRLATIMSRLRAKLAAGGLDIPSAKGSGSYRLIWPQGPEKIIDAVRFEAFLREGEVLLAEGHQIRALECFRAAAREWRGAPFDTVGWSWQAPGACDDFRADLEDQRLDLARMVVEIVLRLGHYEQARFVRGGPVGAGLEAADVVWFLDFLTTLRDEGAAAADRVIESRQQRGSYAQIVDRAFDLLMLQRAGVDVHRPLSGMPQRRAMGSPLKMIGRREEISALEAFLGRLQDGHPVTLSVRGPPGVGKTRLVEEFARSVTDGGIRMVAVSCHSHGELNPWRVLAGTLWANSCRDMSVGADLLSEPQHRTLRDFVTGAPDRPSEGPVHQRHLRDLASALCALLRQAAATSGLIVTFDDADLLTPRGHELLHEVRVGLQGVPVGWLLVGRQDGGWPASPELERGEALPMLLLRPLDIDEVRRWIAQVWSREPTAQESVQAWERTRGLPVHLCELGEPDDARAFSIERPAMWHEDLTQRWLTAAAITSVGLDIDTGLVAGMLSLDGDEADRQLAAAVASWPIETAAGVHFRHDAWRARLISDLDRAPALGRWLNRKAFEMLRERMRSSPWPDPALPIRIAEHARAAGRDITEQEFARACLDAARAEQSGFSSHAAIRWATTGLRERCDRGTRFDLLLTLGDAQNDSGDMSASGDQYLQAYEQAAGRPKWQAAAAIRMARRWSDPGQADEHLLQLLRSSLDGLVGEHDAEARALRLQLVAHLAHKSVMAIPTSRVPSESAPENGPALARYALRRLTPDLPPIVQCEVLNECRWGIFDHASPTETLAISEQLYEVSLRAPSAFFRSEALIALAVDQLRLGPVTRAVDTIAKHRRYIAHNHRSQGEWLQGTLDTLVDLWHGRFEVAERRIFEETYPVVQEALAVATIPADTLQQTWQGQVYWLFRERGRMRELVESDMAAGMESHGYFPIWRAGLILACCDSGRFEEAADRLTALLADTEDLVTLPPHGWAVPTLALLAESCAVLSFADARPSLPSFLVARLRRLLAAHAGEIVLAGWPTALLGPVSRFSGILALAAGDYADALQHFDRALPVVGDARPQVTRLRLDKARAMILSGSAEARHSATGLLSQAYQEADRLGMAQVAQQAQTLLARQ